MHLPHQTLLAPTSRRSNVLSVETMRKIKLCLRPMVAGLAGCGVRLSTTPRPGRRLSPLRPLRPPVSVAAPNWSKQEVAMARRPAVHEMVNSRKVPKPIGPYAQAIAVEAAGGMLFVSGQIPIEVPHGAVFTGPIGRQAELVFTHLKNIIFDARYTMDEVVKC
ncbi:MAG: hypothetical protein EOO40_09740, partial [Deltaproteobacteria bacterium]